MSVHDNQQAMALKGDHGHGSKMAATHDSWDCGGTGGDWIVFKDDEQVLPMYVVHHS